MRNRTNAGKSWAPIAVGLLCALLLVAPASAKKLTVSGPGGAIPPATTPPPTAGALQTSVQIGNKAKGRKVRDVNLTVQTTGSQGSSSFLGFRLTAPSGATRTAAGVPGRPSIGPLTVDDEASLRLCDPMFFQAPDCLYPPFAGTAQPSASLVAFDGGRAKGTWTLLVTNAALGGGTNTLNSWKLTVNAGKPFKTR